MRKSIETARPGSAETMGLTRAQLLAFLPAFASFALLGQVRAAPARIAAARWIERHEEIARALGKGEIKPLAWMSEVEALARAVDVQELMATVNRARIAPAPQGGQNDPKKRYVQFVDAKGEPRRLHYATALFDFAPHNVITPHGHKHMVSAHMVVAGRVRVRNFDRVRDEGNAIVIRPTRDYVARLGDISTMSSDRDNIHWFVPQGGPTTTFDVIISDLDAGAPSYEIQPVDPIGGRTLPNGEIVAPIMTFRDASQRYSADL
jgi:hypothetical protein